MAKVCQVTKRRASIANKVSHANKKSSIRKEVNLISKRYFVAKIGEYVRVRISTRGLRTIDKHGGLETFLLRTPDAQLTAPMLVIKKRIK